MATFSCPMHPEVVTDHPGTCPKCAMRLEPREIPETPIRHPGKPQQPVRER